MTENLEILRNELRAQCHGRDLSEDAVVDLHHLLRVGHEHQLRDAIGHLRSIPASAPRYEINERDERSPFEDDPGLLSSLHSLFSSGGWPSRRRAMYHGPIGDFVLAAAPHTEADPAAMMITSLVAFGAAVNGGPHVVAGNDRHTASLFAGVVGDTSKAGKGTSKSGSIGLIERIDPDFTKKRIKSGFGSGESLIDSLAGTGEDPDMRDTRTLIFEPELARALRVIGREGSTLGTIVRLAWDGSKLETRSRANGTVAVDDYHVGMVGHVVAEELRMLMTSTEIYGGTGNRILWACARRARRLADGGNVPDDVFDKYGPTLKKNLIAARRLGRMKRTSAGDLLWHAIYDTMGDDQPGGLLGAVTARAEPQTLRLSLVYALADGASEIDIQHVEAAWAMWRYCRASAEWIFGRTTGNVNADRLLQGIRAAGERGLDATAQMGVFSNNLKGEDLDALRTYLEDRNMITTEVVKSAKGRPRIISRAVT